jgi:hypothetical protein
MGVFYIYFAFCFCMLCVINPHTLTHRLRVLGIILMENDDIGIFTSIILVFFDH